MTSTDEHRLPHNITTTSSSLLESNAYPQPSLSCGRRSTSKRVDSVQQRYTSTFRTYRPSILRAKYVSRALPLKSSNP